MRTCPECGEDTEAGYAEPCTECGFSASAPVEIGVATPDRAGAPDRVEEPGGRPRRRATLARVVGALVLAALIGADALGVFDEGGGSGPTAEEVEEALVDDAAALGIELTVDCPDDAAETDVGESFECVAANSAGLTRAVPVTNLEDGFEWPRRPLLELGRAGGPRR